jgi:hypothetical protein
VVRAEVPWATGGLAAAWRDAADEADRRISALDGHKCQELAGSSSPVLRILAKKTWPGGNENGFRTNHFLAVFLHLKVGACVKGETAVGDLLSKFDPGELIGLVAVGGGLLIPILCGVTAIITDYFYKIRQLALKQDMLNRGMSAEEICLVLDAGSKRSRKARSSQDSCRV